MADPTDEDTLMVIHRDVIGDHDIGPKCWCRPVILRMDEVDAYLAAHPGDNPVGLDS